jgi:hypothetical protein
VAVRQHRSRSELVIRPSPSCQHRLASNPIDVGRRKFGLGPSLRWGDDQQYRISPRLLAILTALFAKRSAAFQNWLDWPVSCRLPFCKTPDWREYCDQENMLLVYHQKLPTERPHPTLPNRLRDKAPYPSPSREKGAAYRHCERSAAIQSVAHRTGLLRRCAPRNDGGLKPLPFKGGVGDGI